MSDEKKWRTPLYISIMALVVVALFSELIFNDNTILMATDQVNAMGLKQPLKATMMKDFEVAQWNPGVLGGMPTIDATAGDIMYPLAMPFPFIFPIHKSFGMAMIFHIFLAGVAFYFMMRYAFNCGRELSLMGGVFYMLNPQFFSHVSPGHDGKMYLIAWLPFVVWHLKILLEKPGIGRALLVSLGIGMAILTSHVQMAYFMLWGMGAYWLFWLIFSIKDGSSKELLKRGSLAFWFAVIMGCAFGAVQLYPAYTFVGAGWSVRGREQDISFVASWCLHWGEALSLWVPDFGSWFDNYWGDNPFKLNTEYVGLVAMLCALLSLFTKPSRWRIFWASVALFSFMLSMGLHTPLLQIAYYTIPGVNKFRAMSMMMFWFSFAVVLLSTLFFKDLFQGYFRDLSQESLKRWQRGILIGAGVATITLLVSHSSGVFRPLLEGTSDFFPDQIRRFRGGQESLGGIYEYNFRENFIPALWIWWFFTIITLALIFAHIKYGLGVKAIFWVALVLGVVDTVRVNSHFINIQPATAFIHTPPVIRELQRLHSESPFRVYFLPGSSPIESMAGFYDLEGLTGFHDNELNWYRAFRGEHPDGPHSQRPGYYGRGANFDIFHYRRTMDGGVERDPRSYAQGDPYLNISNCHYILFREGGQLKAVRNRNALPRISFSQTFEVVDTTVTTEKIGTFELTTTVHDRMNERFSSGEHDSRSIVLLEESPELVNSVDSSAYSPEIPVRWKRYRTMHRIAEVDVPAPGLLRLAEVWYPGWDIRLNGQRVRPLRADIAWMAIEVPEAGVYTISMRPKSYYLREALWLSVPVWIFTIFWAVWSLIKMIKAGKRS